MKYLNKKLSIQKLVLSFILSTLISLGVGAQNASYYLNSGPIPGTGTSNSGFGYRALFNNTSGSNNTANGYQALYSNSTGGYNTANGLQALYSNTSGYNNTANGLQALYSNTTGYYNTATGYRALFSNTSGRFNTAIGYVALHENTTGINNTASSYKALYSNTTGHDNTADGYKALYSNTTGSENTANGSNALYNNATGSNNTAVGYEAGPTLSNLTNTTAIGSNATVNASNKVVIGNNAVTVIGGYANWSNLSDGRFKENIQEDVPGLSFITRLRPVTYTINIQKLDKHIMQNMPDSIKVRRMKSLEAQTEATTKIHTGFVAQEVEKTIQELDYNFDGINAPQNPADNYSLSYGQFVVPLVKAVQEQQQMIEAKDTEINEIRENLQQQINDLKKLVATLTGKSFSTTGKVPDMETEIPLETDGVRVYPNPNNGLFTVNTNSLDRGEIMVRNLSGVTLQTISLKKNISSYDINLSGYAKGEYLIEVLSSGKTKTTRIIVE